MQERELYVSVEGSVARITGILATFLGIGPTHTVLEREA